MDRQKLSIRHFLYMFGHFCLLNVGMKERVRRSRTVPKKRRWDVQAIALSLSQEEEEDPEEETLRQAIAMSLSQEEQQDPEE